MGKHMKKTLLAIAISTTAMTAHADYQFEAGAFFGQGEVGVGNSSADYDVMGVAGRFNFEAVDTSKGPHAEAAFLDKSSSIGFGWTSIEPDVNGADDIDSFDFDVRVVTADNLIVEASYGETDDGDSESDNFSIGLGTYLDANTDIVASYQSTDDDGADLDQFSVALHGVNPLTQGASLGYDVSLAYLDADQDDGHMLGAGATYYFNKNLGVGLSAELTEIGDYNDNTISLSASYFPQDNIELLVSYFDQGGDVDVDGILFGASARF